MAKKNVGPRTKKTVKLSRLLHPSPGEHHIKPDIQGEESVSGSEPIPSSDDDTLMNAQLVGEQLDENSEHPKEVDIARDINKAEKYHRTH